VVSSEITAPWYIFYPTDPMIVGSAVVVAAWVCFALARAVAARRRVSTIARPPMCAGCGYNLTTMALENRCPECGSAVLDSIGAKVQPGTPWEQPYWATGAIGAWNDTTVEAVMRPERLGRAIRLSQERAAHHSFLAIHFPCVFLIAVVALLIHFAIHEGIAWTIDIAPLTGGVSGTFGIVCILAAFGAVNLAALIVGLIESWLARRNMLPASAQLACYLAPWVISWEIIGAMLTLAIINNQTFFEALEESTGVYRDFLAMGTFIVPNAIAAAVYLYLIARGTKAARYANR
jgi:hypothetical protein